MLKNLRNGTTRKTANGSPQPSATPSVMRPQGVVHGHGKFNRTRAYFSLILNCLFSSPYKPNPVYRGKWYAPMIDNPAYKGEWAPRKIPNPDYFEDSTPVKSLKPIVCVASLV